MLFSRYVVQLVVTTWTIAHQDSLSFTISQSLLKFLSIESVMSIASMMLFVAPFSFCLLSFPASGSNELALHIKWPKDRSFSVSPSNEYFGLISFRIDLFAHLAFQWTLKNLLQHHNLKAWVLWCSAFFMVQLSHLCVFTGKTIAFDYTYVWRQCEVSAFQCAI